MFLHNNQVLFNQLVTTIAENTGIDVAILLKDYYVFMLLKLIRHNNDEIMFKGGTSLSKAWRVTARFSEDIDLNLKPEVESTDSHRKRLTNSILSAISTLGLSVDTSHINSRMEFNKYNVTYPHIATSYLLETIKIESMANKKGKLRNATYSLLPISSYIWDFCCNDANYRGILQSYGLAPFNIEVQDMDVTFVEKLMSLTNNYIKGNSQRLSRHLYDIYCMGVHGNLLGYDLEKAIQETKRYLLERTNDVCLRMPMYASVYLRNALDTDFYKQDFESNLSKLRYNTSDGITYEVCKAFLLNLLNNLPEF